MLEWRLKGRWGLAELGVWDGEFRQTRPKKSRVWSVPGQQQQRASLQYLAQSFRGRESFPPDCNESTSSRRHIFFRIGAQHVRQDPNSLPLRMPTRNQPILVALTFVSSQGTNPSSDGDNTTA